MGEDRKTLFAQLQRIMRNLIGKRRGPGGDEPDDDGDALVGAPIRPRTPLRSGAVALEEPDDFDR
ncbi:MAG: hypothetical protein ABR976_20545 [Terracidiphilus sp.]|jgi:hypothetical protein